MKNIFFVFLFYLSSIYLGMSQTQYEIKGVDDLLDIIEVYGIDRGDYETVEFNSASLFRLPGERLILIPSIGEEGILFNKDSIFVKMLDEKHFPVKDDESLFAVERNRIEKLESNIDFFIKRLSELTNIKLTKTDGISNLAVLSEKIEKIKEEIGTDEAYRKLLVCLGIYVGEIVKTRAKSYWNLEKYEVMNPYWIPTIKSNDQYRINLWRPIDDYLLRSDNKDGIDSVINKIVMLRSKYIKSSDSKDSLDFLDN